MGIPLAALAVQPQPDILNQYGKAVGIQGALQNQQYLQQARPMELQEQQEQLKAAQYASAQRAAMDAAYKKAVTVDANGQPNIDTDVLQKTLADAGHGSAIPGILENVTKFQQSKAALTESMQKIQSNGQDMAGNIAKAIQQAKYDPSLAHTLLDTLPQGNPQIQQLRQLIDSDPATFRQHVDAAVAQSPSQQKMQNEQTVAGIRANNPAMQEMNDWLAKNPGKGASDFETWKATQAPEQRELNDFLAKNPGKGPADFVRFKSQNSPSVIIQGGATGAAADPMIDMVGQGRIDLPTVLQRMQPAAKAGFLSQLAAKYPQYSQAEYGVQKQVQEAFTSGTYSQQLNAINTAREHMTTFKTLATALDNGDSQALNKVKNAWQEQFGSAAPTNFLLARDAFAGEVGKSLAGAGVTQGDRQEVQESINRAESPKQLIGAAQTADALLAGKQKALKDTYEKGMQGKPNFGTSKPAPTHKVGDTVSYKGQPHVIQAINPDGSLVLK